LLGRRLHEDDRGQCELGAGERPCHELQRRELDNPVREGRGEREDGRACDRQREHGPTPPTVGQREQDESGEGSGEHDREDDPALRQREME
jgi:hypothetical protein